MEPEDRSAVAANMGMVPTVGEDDVSSDGARPGDDDIGGGDGGGKGGRSVSGC